MSKVDYELVNRATARIPLQKNFHLDADWVRRVASYLAPEAECRYSKEDMAIMLSRAVQMLRKLQEEHALATARAERLDRIDAAINAMASDLQHRLDREIATSRDLAKRLNEAEDLLGNITISHQDSAHQMAEAFMTLHNIAKDVVGPKIRPPLKADPIKFETGGSVTVQLKDVDPELVKLMTDKRPTFGEMLKAAEAGESEGA